MSECLCCHDPLLRHIEGHQLRWFCRRCWQFMPSSTIEASEVNRPSVAIAPPLSSSLPARRVARPAPSSLHHEVGVDRSGKFAVKPTFRVSKDSTSQLASAID